MRNQIREVRKLVSHSPSLVANALNVSRQTVYRMLEDGRLKGTTLNDVVDYVQGQLSAKGRDNSPPTRKGSAHRTKNPVPKT